MNIILSQYQENVAVPVEHVYEPKAMDLEFVDLHYLGKLLLEGVVEKGHDTLNFHGRLMSDVEHICGRCLKTVPDHVDQSFELFYEIKDQDAIDTTDDLREILILNHPINFVCREDCRGLCPQCGVNRNEVKCQCPEQAENKPLSSLKDLWKKREDKKNGKSKT